MQLENIKWFGESLTPKASTMWCKNYKTKTCKGWYNIVDDRKDWHVVFNNGGRFVGECTICKSSRIKPKNEAS